MAIAVVVVSHDSTDSKLSETLAAIKTNSVDNVFTAILDSQEKQAAETNQLFLAAKTFEDAVAELSEKLTNYDWLWLLSAGQIPKAHALAEMLSLAERSASAAIIAPKIMHSENERLIKSFGLTLTPRSSLFEPVRDELDQAQHDSKEDTLGACLEGSLISPAKIVNAGGARTELSSLAADLELSIRLRLRGLRVLLAPNAKVISSDDGRIRERTADLELKLFYYPAFKAFVFWLLLPWLVIIESLWLMLRKQPELIGQELASGFKVFFRAFRIAASRSSLKRSERRNLKSLRPLYATRNQVANSKLSREEVDVAAPTSSIAESATFFRSGAAWVALALLAVSWQFWPTNVDAAGPGLLPFGDNWLSIFTATGAGYQNIGTGFYAPSDPFNWLLLSIASITFWSPGLALVGLLFAAKSLAFAAAFKAVTLVTRKVWLAILAGLTYAFWPSFTSSLSEGRIPAILVHLILPIYLYSLIKLGSKQKQSQQSTWALTGLNALATAGLSVAAPYLSILLVAVWVGLLIVRIRKIGYFIWLILPMAALWLPTIWYRVVGLGEPLSLLADPGLPLSTKSLSPFEFLTSAWLQGNQLVATVAASVLLLVCSLAFARSAVKPAIGLGLTLLVSVAMAYVIQQIEFVGNPVIGQTGQTWVNGSAHAVLSLAALCIALLLGLALNELKAARALGLLAFPAVAALGLVSLLEPSAITYSDGRVVPALIRAEAKQNSALKLLVLQPETDNRFSATLVSDDGIHMADLSTSYRFALSQQKYNEVAQLAANLVSAASEDLTSQLSKLEIGYVMVPDFESDAGRNLVSNIDSVIGLSAIGKTEFGQLWRAGSATELPIKPPTNQDLWSLTKGVQLTVILLFALLAIPNRRRQSMATDEEQDSFSAGDSDE